MYVGAKESPELRSVAERQGGVITRSQLTGLGFSPGYVNSQVYACRWTAMTSRVVLLHNHKPTRQQWMWIALLDAGQPSALASHTALEWAGFHAFAREAERIHVVVPRGATPTRFATVTLHESRRFTLDDVWTYRGMSCTEKHRSAVDAGAWQRSARFAVATLAAAVQQRVCSVTGLQQALNGVGQVRHRRPMQLALGDIAGGAEALSEIDIAVMCRRFGLPPPHRQQMRRDRSGKVRYLDCEWKLANGATVVLEIDGSHHMQVENWGADMKRQRKVVTKHRHLLRATAMEARFEQADIVVDLVAMGVSRLAA